MKQINLIPHVHWDREWYFTSIEAKVLLFHHLNEVLDFLPDTPDDYVDCVAKFSWPCFYAII